MTKRLQPKLKAQTPQRRRQRTAASAGGRRKRRRRSPRSRHGGRRLPHRRVRPTSKRSRSTNGASRRCSGTTTTRALELFQSVLRQYPEEKELHERVRLYLNICERQATPREAAPQTIEERLYAVDARDQRRTLRRGDRASAPRARRRSRQRSRALHARGRARAARRARRSGRAPRARDRAQPRESRARPPRPGPRAAARRRGVPGRLDGRRCRASIPIDSPTSTVQAEQAADSIIRAST